MRCPLAVAAFSLCTTVFGQVLTLPIGYDLIEGESFNNQLFNQSYIRWQQIDDETVGMPRLIRRINLRRDGQLPTPQAQNRSLDIEVGLGLGLFSSFGTMFADNWLTGSTTTVFTRKTVNLPDWSQLPPLAPAAFDLILQNNYTYAHSGVGSLVFMFQVWDSSAPSTYIADAVAASGIATAAIQRVGSGCTTPNGRFGHAAAFQITGFGAASDLTLAATNAPGLAPVTALLGFSDPNLPLGLCTSLRTDALLSIPIGSSSAGGVAGAVLTLGAFNDFWAGSLLYTQAVAPDATQPQRVALSAGVRLALPRRPYNMKHTFATNPAANGAGLLQGGLVLQIL